MSLQFGAVILLPYTWLITGYYYYLQFLPAQRYANTVLAVVLCLSICRVRHK